MGSRYEVELKIESARDLKNVNRRYGDLRAYAVACVDPAAKFSTKADFNGDTNPVWDEKLTIPIPGDLPLDDAVLFIEVVDAVARDIGVEPLVGSACLPLREILDEAGVGGQVTRSLTLRPHGRIEVKVRVVERDPPRCNVQPAASAARTATPLPRDYPYRAPPTPPNVRVQYGQPAASGGSLGTTVHTADRPYAVAPPAGLPYSTPPTAVRYHHVGVYGQFSTSSFYPGTAVHTAGRPYGTTPPAWHPYGQGAGYGYGQEQGEGVGYDDDYDVGFDGGSYD